MLRLTLLAVFNFLLFTSTGQISILKSDFLLIGDTARVSVSPVTNVDFTTTGATSVWDFTILQAESQKLINPTPVSQSSILIQFNFGNFAPVRYASDYFDSNTDLPFAQAAGFLPVDIEDYSIFTKITNDSVTHPGYSLRVDGNEVPFRSDTIEVPYYFPLEFGDSYSGRAYSKINFNPFFDGIFIQYRQRETHVDGYGTLMTPYGNFSAIRVKHTIQEQDSLYFNFSGFAQWIPINQPTTHIYEWWAKDEKVPVLKVETRLITGTETVTSIEYKDIYLGLDASLTSNALTFDISPNPVSDHLTISSDQPFDRISIHTLSGQQVMHFSEIHQSHKVLDVSVLPSGIYFCIVERAGIQNVKRIIVQ